MEKEDKPQSGYRILNMVLMESTFNRILQVSFNPEEVKPTSNVDVAVTFDNNLIIVTETLQYESVVKGIKEVSATIKMVGVFEKFGETPPISPEDFGNINGPAIIFPFIREHLAALSLKAVLGQILLPPMNFVNKAQEKK